jgi:hypothetical protein
MENKKQICVNEMICPLCKQPNDCMAKSELPCWCNTIKVPIELREFIPSELRMKACICKSCIEAFKTNQNEFLKDLKISSL